MFNNEACIKGLADQVYAALSAASTVAVLGWQMSWHNQWTLKVEDLRHAIFVDDVHKKIDLGPTVGFVLYTHRIGHDHVRGLKRKKPTAPVCLRPHQIQALFHIWCTQMQWPPEVRRRA